MKKSTKAIFSTHLIFNARESTLIFLKFLKRFFHQFVQVNFVLKLELGVPFQDNGHDHQQLGETTLRPGKWPEVARAGGFTPSQPGRPCSPRCALYSDRLGLVVAGTFRTLQISSLWSL